MQFSFSTLTYKQKGLLAEMIYLAFIGIVSPFAVGLQIFNHLSFTLSLVLLNILGLPVIVLFYRVYLPYTIGKGKYVLASLLFPVYLVLYELSSRLSCIMLIHLPIIPEKYRLNLMSAHPDDFTKGYFNQSLGYTGLVLLAATSLYLVKLLFKNQENLINVETEKLKLELNQLKLQIQPHFFFNTLNNMYALSVQKSPETPKMIKNLSSIMRYVLYESNQDKVSLEKEVDFINSYIQLESFRHTPSDLIEFSTQGNFSHVMIEPLLFMPLIENTFKHVLHQNITDKWIKIVLSVDEQELIFQTSNVLPPSIGIANESGGIGLKNVRKRLNLLYPDQHELTIFEEENSFTVTLVINLI
ncbi:sensor histidine kinase [Pedobacter terrae]|uniref:sensor histidine kinase n=1 Tax=Pedobacter terrae TaxID=405671 RepID=UPI002FFA33C8